MTLVCCANALTPRRPAKTNRSILYFMTQPFVLPPCNRASIRRLEQRSWARSWKSRDIPRFASSIGKERCTLFRDGATTNRGSRDSVDPRQCARFEHVASCLAVWQNSGIIIDPHC